MVKLYNRMSTVKVKGYGHAPVYFGNGGTGQVLFQSAKQMGRYAVPILKKVWRHIPPETKRAMYDATVDLGIRTGKKIGNKLGLGIGEYLGDKAQEKLEQMTDVVDTERMSKKAEQLLKKMTKSVKKKVKKAIKRKELPKSITSKLSARQKKLLSKGSDVLLSNLLGSGLKLM
jgi:hypothetical protein